MDDGDIDVSDRDEFSGSQLICDYPLSPSWDSFVLDEYLKTCTHRHTCNPPGPDKTHTHTCFHTHTQVFTGDKEENSTRKDVSNHQEIATCSKKKRPVGNKEAVRKYREKKKAQAVHLEEQVAQLKSINQRLLRRLQGQAALEAEVVRLRSLLSEIRGKIDVEVDMRGPAGNGPLQSLPGGYFLNSFEVPCDADVRCLHTTQGLQAGSTKLSNESLGCYAACDMNGSCPSRDAGEDVISNRKGMGANSTCELLCE